MTIAHDIAELRKSIDRLIAMKARRRGSQARALDRIARKFEPAMRAAILRALRKLGDSIDLEAIAAAIESGGVEAAIRALQFDQAAASAVRSELSATLAEAYAASGAATAAFVRSEEAFDVLSTRGLRFLESRAATLVQQIGDDARMAIRSAVVDARGMGLSANNAARLIRPLVGVMPQHSGAPMRRLGQLLANGIAEDKAFAEMRSYTERLRQHRALTIARTEPRFAASYGQREAMEQAIDDGLFERTELQRQWVLVQAEHEPNDPCVELDGVIVGMDEEFPGGYMAPPDPHPNCTCQLEYIFP